MNNEDPFFLFKLCRIGQVIFFAVLIVFYFLRKLIPSYYNVIIIVLGLLCMVCFAITIFWKCKNSNRYFCGARSPFLNKCANCGKSMKEMSKQITNQST